MEEQDKIRKMEQQEEDEMKAVSTALRDEDEAWERRKNVKKTVGSITTGSSTKRGSQNERNQGRRKRLKHEVLAEGWGVLKSSPDPREEGAARDTGQVPVLPTIGGGTVQNIREDGTGQHHVLHSTITGALGSTEEPSPPEGADVMSSPHQVIGGGTLSKLGDDNAHRGGGAEDTLGEHGQQNVCDDTRPCMGGMVTLYDVDVRQVVKDAEYGDSGVKTNSMSAPSSSNTLKQSMNKDDIQEQCAVKPGTECKFNKRKRMCMRHECEAQSYEVTSKKWKWIEKRKEYGFVSQKCVKWRCMRAKSMGDQVQNSANPDLRKQPAEVLTDCGNLQTEGLGTLTGDNRDSTGSAHEMKEKVFDRIQQK